MNEIPFDPDRGAPGRSALTAWCREWERRIELRNFAIPTKIRLDYEAGMLNGIEGLDLVITIRVLDRQTGAPTTLTQREFMERPWWWESSFFRDRILHSIERLMLHEVREAFHVDGLRIHDPHKNEPGYVPEHAPPSPPPWYRGAPGDYREPPRRPSMLDFIDPSRPPRL